MKHTDDCIAWTAQAEAARRDYATQWPDHCTKCEGWGGGYSTYDPSPTGVSLSPGYMYDYDPCQHCIEIGKCPRCGRMSAQLASFIEGEAEDAICEHCGWSERTPDGMPQPHECGCWVFDGLDGIVEPPENTLRFGNDLEDGYAENI